jgi:predicted protein tyrosine phosphatase
MINYNQLANTKNPYQGDAVKALCVCSAGLLRSPSIAKFLTEKGYNTRSAGANKEYALIPTSPALLLWADEVHVVREQFMVVCKQLEDLKEELGDHYKKFRKTDPVMYTYNIPDSFCTFDEKLMQIIEDTYEGFKNGE